MPRLEVKPKFRNTIAGTLRWLICLLALLALVVPVQVQAVPPQVHDDEFTVLEDSDDRDNRLDVLRNDEPLPGEPFEIVGVTQGANGSVEIVPGNTLVSYQPDGNYDGTDQFTYRVDDGFGRLLVATVRITVQGINDRPNAVDDTATTNEDQQVVIDVLDNDRDIDGNLDPASVMRISGPSNGEVTVNTTTGEIAYRPNDDWHGQDTFTYRVCDDGSPLPARCDQANVSITVRPVSDRPIADAGPDQAAPTLSTVTLDGSGSYDPDGDVELSYQWQQIGGTQQVTLSDPTAESPTFAAPGDPEVLTFSLIVFDDQGQASANTDTTHVTVTNQAPVADAGPDQSVPVETPVTLDGSASYDPDHDDLGFEWEQTGGPRVSLSSWTAVSPTFTAPATASRLTFSLRVRDAYDATSLRDQTVIDVYEPPTFSLYLPFATYKQAFLPDLVITSITATRYNIRVVLKNQGDSAVTHGFYVDAYIDPRRAPTGAHEGWDTPGISSGRGLVWAVEIAPVSNPPAGIVDPLLPGETLTLNYNDAFYQPGYSSMSWPLAAGTRVYAQVDSYPDTSPNNGLVTETHEYYNQSYNNILGPVISSSAAGSVVAPSSRPHAPAPPMGLPPRR